VVLCYYTLYSHLRKCYGWPRLGGLTINQYHTVHLSKSTPQHLLIIQFVIVVRRCQYILYSDSAYHFESGSVGSFERNGHCVWVTDEFLERRLQVLRSISSFSKSFILRAQGSLTASFPYCQYLSKLSPP